MEAALGRLSGRYRGTWKSGWRRLSQQLSSYQEKEPYVSVHANGEHVKRSETKTILVRSVLGMTSFKSEFSLCTGSQFKAMKGNLDYHRWTLFDSRYKRMTLYSLLYGAKVTIKLGGVQFASRGVTGVAAVAREHPTMRELLLDPCRGLPVCSPRSCLVQFISN